MNFDRLKLRHLQCLVVVAQERSLMRAAAVLSLTQPAVSKSLADLEDIVGRPLFRRHARGVELTPAGRTLLGHAGSGMRLLREGLDLAIQQPDPDRSTIRIGALPNLSAALIPQAILRLLDEQPVSLARVATGTNAQLLAQLRSGEIDAVFGRLAEPAEMIDLQFEKLFEEPMVVLARPGHPLAGQLHPSAGGIEQYPLILPTSGTVIRRTVDNFLLELGRGYPQQIIESTDVSLALALAQRSDAIWFTPQGVATPLLERDTLVQLRIDTGATLGAVGLSTRIAFEPPAALARLFAIVHELVAQRHPPRNTARRLRTGRT
ncbi:MAG: LysR substrate-binding domain-containing protein [Burkholderiaceae bacterium]